MPNAHYKLIDGSELSAQNLKNKVVVMTFWSTTCGACIVEIPHLSSLHENYREQGLEIVAVALKQDPLQAVVRLASDKKIPYKVAYDAGGTLARSWGGITYTPTTFIIDRDGVVVESFIGSQPNRLDEWIAKLL